MKIITFEQIKKLNISSSEYYQWIDDVLRHREDYQMPTKTRIKLSEADYFNVMPCATPKKDDFIGAKIVSRNELRHQKGGLNLDSQIYLFQQSTCELLAVMDGTYITTVRTAAVAAHTFLNLVDNYETISMVGLGNIGTSIGEILFPKLPKNKKIQIKLFKYKDHAERFKKRFAKYNQINFEIVNNYDDLMKNSDVIISSVSFIDQDFCDEKIYKPGCTIIPVHMRGFMECDKTFDHIIASDMERIKGFKYYDYYKKLSSTDDVLFNHKPLREKPTDRVIIYNLGLSITDLYFAGKIYHKLSDKIPDAPEQLAPSENFYM